MTTETKVLRIQRYLAAGGSLTPLQALRRFASSDWQRRKQV